MPSLKLPELLSKTDILIVGAGPSGLALAAELRRRGIGTVTVDKVAEGANTTAGADSRGRPKSPTGARKKWRRFDGPSLPAVSAAVFPPAMNRPSPALTFLASPSSTTSVDPDIW